MKSLRIILLLSGMLFFSSNVKTQNQTLLSNIEKLTKTNLKESDKQINILYNNSAIRLTDLEKNELLYYRAYTLVNLGYIDSALVLFSSCLNKAKENGLIEIKIKCLCEIGNIYYNWGQYITALKYFIKAQKESLSPNQEGMQAEALNYIGKYHHSMGEFDKSLEYFNNSLRLAKRNNCIELQAILLANIGKYYETIGNYDLSLSSYIEALRTVEKVDDRIIKGTVYNHLGNLYQAIGNFPQSLFYHEMGLNERLVIGFTEGISKSYKNLGEIHLELNHTDTALYYFKEALFFAQQVNYQKGTIKSLLDIGTIYLRQKNPEKARTYFYQALNLSSAAGYDKGIIQANFYLGESFMDDNQCEKAEPFFLSSLKDASTIQMKDMVVQNSNSLYKLYLKLGKPLKAIEYMKTYYEGTMELNNERTAKHIAELEMNYTMEQKEKANELLRQQNEIKTLTIARKNGFITLTSISLGLTLVIIFAFYLRFKSKQKANQQLAKLNTEIIRQNRILTRLNEQLNLVNHEKDNFFSIIAHEVRNPLWWFRNLAETLSENYDKMPKEKLGKAIQSLDESAKNSFHLMDNLLQWSKSQLNRTSFQPQELRLSDLLDENLKLWKTVANYKNITINVAVDSQLKIFVDRDMVHTIVRNLISNAIKYTHQEGNISIQAKRLENMVTLTFQDSGIGINDENLKKLFDPNHQFSTLGIMQEKGSGIGLKLCKDFVEMNKGSIHVASVENQGTTFTCTFPIKELVSN